MSHEPPHGVHVVRASKTRGTPWLAAGALAVALVGGGYVAWKATAPNEPNVQVAANEPNIAAPIEHAAPQATPPAAIDEAPPVAAAPAEPRTTRAAPVRHRANARTQHVTARVRRAPARMQQAVAHVRRAPAPQRMAAAAPMREPLEARLARHRATERARIEQAAVTVRPQPVPEPVPEQVVGVTLIDATMDGDEIVIPGIRQPVWRRVPSAYRLSTLYPERALERGREGEASVHCTVLDGGALDCVEVSEKPAHAGFGDAAMRVASAFRHAQYLRDGSDAVGTPVNLRVVFRMAE